MQRGPHARYQRRVGADPYGLKKYKITPKAEQSFILDPKDMNWPNVLGGPAGYPFPDLQDEGCKVRALTPSGGLAISRRAQPPAHSLLGMLARAADVSVDPLSLRS
jgi:hypothetical protein